MRAYGSPNSIYATEICNWHKDYATRFTTGSDIGTPDFAGTDCVLLWGNNPAATWLARATEVQKAVKRGARMIVVDPRPTAFAKRADQWLRVSPGTDRRWRSGSPPDDRARLPSTVRSCGNGPTVRYWCAPIPAASCAAMWRLAAADAGDWPVWDRARAGRFPTRGSGGLDAEERHRP